MSFVNGYHDPRSDAERLSNLKVFEVRVTWNDGRTEILPMTVNAINFYRGKGIQIISLVRLEETTPPPEPEPKLEPEPIPNLINSFTQKIISVEYKPTTLGKSLFLQIQLTKVKDYPQDSITAFLQIKNQGGIVAMILDKTISVKGVTNRSIIWEIPNIKNATAVMFINHLILEPINQLIIANKISDVKIIFTEPDEPKEEHENKSLMDVLEENPLGLIAKLGISAVLLKTFLGGDK